MSGNGIFGIGASGLLAYQRALQTTGHNIANVGTEGFSRQRVDLDARAPSTTGFGSLGNGVTVSGVNRIADFFVEMRLIGNTSDEAFHRVYAEFADQIDNLVADPEGGLAPALDNFFNAVQEVASDPTSTAARQQLISEGEALTSRFAQLESRIEAQRRLANGRIQGTVDEINQIASGIADLNEQIITARGRSGGPPNDLLDSRDQLLRELAERVSVSTLEQSDGSVNVYAGRGQALVVGVETTPLSSEPSPLDPTRLEIGLRNGATFVPVTNTLTGGALGALLDVRNSILDPASQALGRVAVGITEQFNQAHANGMDLSGLAGTDFFGRPAPAVRTDSGNSATGTPTLVLSDVGALEASDYELRFDGANWALRRLSDGQQLASLAPGSSFAFDGLDLDLSGVAGAAAGDRYLLQPTRVTADLEVLITSPRAIAAALPVRAEAAAANAGGATIESLAVTDPGNPQLRDPVAAQFTGGNFVAGAVVVPLDPSGETTIDVNGWQLVVRGTPAEGDVFSVGDNVGGIGDNRNALALAGIAARRVMGNGTTTLNETYAELVSDVGVKTQRARINADVQAQLLGESRAQRESISGVNLDEEAANLIRFQQAYEASAQVIAVAGTMFDSLLAAVRR